MDRSNGEFHASTNKLNTDVSNFNVNDRYQDHAESIEDTEMMRSTQEIPMALSNTDIP